MNLDPTEILVGGLTREALMDRLTVAGVRLNPHAQVLLNSAAFDCAP
ncbi:hypothetical protein [Xylanimonas ulmi]|nr:hypothetical protein [Xylanibacterium ulmi]